MIPKYFFILNPGANKKRSAKYIKAIKLELKVRDVGFDFKETITLEDAYVFSQEANFKGYDVVVAVGGDGTINRVINGFYDEVGKRISQSKLGVIHIGTSPDFCESYGIPINPVMALDILLKNNFQEISIAQIEYRDDKRKKIVGYFGCCASLGLGAKVAQNANSGIRRFLGDTIGTFISILKSLIGFKPSDLKLVCDGREKIIEKNVNTFIGKTPFIASGMKVAHQLSKDDDRLYILSLKKINFRNVLPALMAIYSGKPVCNKNYISFDYARSIEILEDKINSQIEFDGDPQGYLPCKISIAEDKLELINNGF